MLLLSLSLKGKKMLSVQPVTSTKQHGNSPGIAVRAVADTLQRVGIFQLKKYWPENFMLHSGHFTIKSVFI
uniref:Uncharacterized protein n=1 Tax=Kalanchoe fedtschenkoi TaxID=63787 RepID=A0A7N0VDV2_KALFE